MPIKHVQTSVLDIAYEESGPADGTPVFLLHGFPYDPRAFDGVVPLLARMPRAGAVPARLWTDAIPLRRHDALGRAGRARQRPARIHGRAAHRARGARRLRLGRARGLHRGGAMARAYARARHLRRLQHARREGLGEAGLGRAGASLLVSVLFLHAARRRGPDAKTGAASRSCSGRSGRRTGVRRCDVRGDARARSTIRTSSRW